MVGTDILQANLTEADFKQLRGTIEMHFAQAASNLDPSLTQLQLISLKRQASATTLYHIERELLRLLDEAPLTGHTDLES